ncbi:MAG: hypothetical protein ACOYXC_11115 [Candidatus Rifleibacteriota bacterium]
MTRFAILLVFLLACGNFLAAQDSLLSDSFLFVKSYQNWAWGAEYKGIIVDGAGQVFSFSFPEKELGPDFASEKPDTIAGLKEYFNKSRSLLKSIPAAEVEKMAGLISQVENASYSEDVHTACDAGTNLWLAYRQDKNSGQLKEVLLSKTGDFTQKSDSPAAKILVEWLDGLIKK